jgi:hypothetical protein
VPPKGSTEFETLRPSHVTPQLRIPRAIDLPYAARAKRGGDFVRAESSPAGKGHRVLNDFTLTTIRLPKSS